MSTTDDGVAGAAHSSMRPRRTIWRHRAFTALWSAHTLSQFGTQITFFALPVLAVTTLGASKAELGVLAAAESLPFLLTGNARLEFSRSTAESAGPGLGGLAVQWSSAASPVWGNVLRYLGSALLLGLIGPRRHRATSGKAVGHGVPAEADRDQSPAERQPDPLRDPGDTMAGSIRDGLRFVFGQPILRTLALSTATANLFGIGGALSALLTAFGLMLLATADRADATVVVTVAIGLVAGSVTIYNIAQVSLRQAITPARPQGRMNASMRFAIWGTLPLGALPLGALAGGALGDAIGIRLTLWCLGALACTACLPLLSRPVRTLREMPGP